MLVDNDVCPFHRAPPGLIVDLENKIFEPDRVVAINGSFALNRKDPIECLPRLRFDRKAFVELVDTYFFEIPVRIFGSFDPSYSKCSQKPSLPCSE